jgi:hypothetical protein
LDRFVQICIPIYGWKSIYIGHIRSW